MGVSPWMFIPNTEVFQVNEGDGVMSDYTFPEKSDMSKVQYASRTTYVKELNMWGNVKDKKVQFDRKTGKWVKLNFFQSIKAAFHKVDNIPGQVVSEDGKFVLHTLEAKRPVGDTVKEAELTTLQDAKVDLSMKYKHMEQALRDLRVENQKLKSTNTIYESRIRMLNARLVAANLSAINFGTPTISREPPTYGNITPSETAVKRPPTPERTPPKKDEKLDKRGDEVIRQFEENKKANEAKLDEEYTKWIADHPDKPHLTKEEYVAMKKREDQKKRDDKDGESH